MALTEREKLIAQQALQKIRQQPQTQTSSMTWEEFDAPVAPQEEPKEPGLLRNVGSSLKKRGADILNTMKETARGDISGAETGVRVVGDVIGGAGDVLFEGLKSGAKAILPDAQEEKLKKLGVDILQTDLGRAGVAALGKGAESYEEWKTNNPRIAESLEGVLNIASILPTTKGAQVTSKAVAPALTATKEIVGDVAKQAGTNLAKNVATKEIDDVLKVVKRSASTMTKAEKEAALRSGRGVEDSLLGMTTKLDVMETPREQEMARLLIGVVDPKKSTVENLNAVQENLATTAKTLKNAVVDNDAMFNTRELNSVFNKARKKSEVIFGGDKTVEGAYDSIAEVMKEEIKKAGGNKLSSLLQARKNFDNIIEQKFPNIFSKFDTDNVRANAVKDVRRSVNEFLAAKLPQGSALKVSLEEQTLMFDALDNIAANNADLVGRGLLERAGRIIRKSPVTSVLGVGAAGLTASALAGIIASPVAIGSLLAYGTYKLGKKVITSEALQKSLSDFLLKAGKTLNPTDKKAVEELIEKMSKMPAGLSIEDVSKLTPEETLARGLPLSNPTVGKTVSDDLIKEAKKYKTTVNIQYKNDLEYLRRILSESQIDDIKAGKMNNFRGIPYEDLARVNIISETPKTIEQQLAGKVKDIKLKSDVFYHGTSAENADSILKSNFKFGSRLPEDNFRGGGYGQMQNSISFTETPKDASRFSSLAKNGKIIEIKLKPNSKVVSIDGIEDAIDLEDYISYLKKQKVDAVYIGGGEKELVVLNPKVIYKTKLSE